MVTNTLSLDPAAASAERLAHVENVRAIFGSHPEDVIRPIKTAADVLGWLEEIFQTLTQEANAERMNSVRMKRAIDAGLYLASDFGNYMDCEHERMLDSLRLAGVIPEKSNTAA